jgi:hypothetical protein
MQTIQTRERTGADGTLTVRVPLGQPDTEFDVVVVLQPKAGANGAAARPPAARQADAIDAFRERLAATGRDFGDSVQDIREDRDR